MERKLYIINRESDGIPVYAVEADSQSEALYRFSAAIDKDFDDVIKTYFIGHSQAFDSSKYKTVSQSRKERYGETE